MQELPQRREPTTREKIIVLIIIAVVVGFGTPSFLQFRRQALNGTCVSNLRNLSEGIRLYSQDNDDILPLSHYQHPKTKQLITWAELLSNYTDPKYLTCPADPSPKGPPFMDISSRERVHISYGYFPGASGALKEKLAYNGSELAMLMDTSDAGYRIHPMPGIPAEKQALFVGFDTPDGRYSKSAKVMQNTAVMPAKGSWPAPTKLRTRHGETLNVLFADGHIESVPMNTVFLDNTAGAPSTPWNPKQKEAKPLATPKF